MQTEVIQQGSESFNILFVELESHFIIIHVVHTYVSVCCAPEGHKELRDSMFSFTTISLYYDI